MTTRTKLTDITEPIESVPDSVALDEIRRYAATLTPASSPKPTKDVPSELDLSTYLHYVRSQGGQGCWGYSLLAICDIMNEMVCPYSPNLSMNLGLFMHRRRDLWENQGGINSPDGRFHKVVGNKWMDQSFGVPTEGTELTHPSTRWTGNWTSEGVNEADNYRLASDVKTILVRSGNFIDWLSSGHPIQLEDNGHVIAVVGYSVSRRTFKFVNSYGDRWGQDGFGQYTFEEIDEGRGKWGRLGNAYVVDIIPPRPVPTARIHFHHADRMNVFLWLSAEGSPRPKRRIWPPYEWFEDNSRNLHYTVRLPSEFVWPPSSHNRILLDIYDSAMFSETGGKLIEFTAAFGGHIISSANVADGHVHFGAYEHVRLEIP